MSRRGGYTPQQVEAAKYGKRRKEEIKEYIIEKYNKILADRYDNELPDLVENEFYGSFDPLYYDRQNGISNAISIYQSGVNEITADIEESLPTNHQSEGLVFKLVFMQGYHGGSQNVHRYRVPYDIYAHFGGNADKTTPPWNLIDEFAYEICDEVSQDAQEEYDELMHELREEIIDMLS